MDIDIIITCERCGAKFMFTKPPTFCFANNFNADHTAKQYQPEGGPVIRRKYVESLDRSEYYVERRKTGVKVFCERCDAAYWKNFDEAVKILESFWHKPLE